MHPGARKGKEKHDRYTNTAAYPAAMTVSASSLRLAKPPAILKAVTIESGPPSTGVLSPDCIRTTASELGHLPFLKDEKNNLRGGGEALLAAVADAVAARVPWEC